MVLLMGQGNSIHEAACEKADGNEAGRASSKTQCSHLDRGPGRRRSRDTSYGLGTFRASLEVFRDSPVARSGASVRKRWHWRRYSLHFCTVSERDTVVPCEGKQRWKPCGSSSLFWSHLTPHPLGFLTSTAPKPTGNF